MPVLSRKKRILFVMLALATFVWIAHSAHVNLSRQKAEQAPQGPLLTGMTLPYDLVLEGLGAKKTPLSDYRGKVVLINFWAGWCGPCLHEMPDLYALYGAFKDKGLVVLGLNMDEDPQLGLRVLKKVAGDAPFPMFRGMGSELADRFAIEGLPFTVILDKNFHIAYAHAGEVDWNGAQARKVIEGLL